MSHIPIRVTRKYLRMFAVVILLVAKIVSGDMQFPEEKPYQLLKFEENYLKDSEYSFLPESWAEIDLNRKWKLKKLPGTKDNPSDDNGMKSGYWKKDFEDTQWDEMQVPWCWDSSSGMGGEGNYRTNYDGVGWYRLKVEIPENYREKRIVICFDAVDYEATVWVNGKKIGKHIGGRTPFQFDITEVVDFGIQNTIAVRVFNESETYNGKKWHALGGIWQPVKIIICPKIYATCVLITPRIDNSTIEIDYWVNNTFQTRKKVNLVSIIQPAKGTELTAKGKGVFTKTKLGKFKLKPGKNKLKFSIKINKPIYWSPDNPYLYSLIIKDAKDIETKQRFGFREFKVTGKHFYLNGKRIYLMANSVQKDAFRMIPAISIFNQGNFLKKYLLCFKSAHINLLRAHSSPRPSNFYNICDEIGMMIFAEWNTHGALVMAGDNLKRYKKEIPEWMVAQYNHPSIVMWSAGNELFECWAMDRVGKSIVPYCNELYDVMKNTDKSRPISISGGTDDIKSGIKVDFVDKHTYHGYWKPPENLIALLGQNSKQITKTYGSEKPLFLGECIGIFYEGKLRDKKKWRGPAQKIFKGDKVDKARYVKWLTTKGFAPWPDGSYWWTAMVSNVGLRLTACGELEDWDREFEAKVAKNLMEIFRRIGDTIQGFEPYIGSKGFELVDRLFDGKPVVEFGHWAERYENLESAVWATTPLYWVTKRCMNPTFVCLDLFNKNIIAGNLLKLKIHAINDLPEVGSDWKVRIILRDRTKRKTSNQVVEIGDVDSHSRKVMGYSCSVPENSHTGFYSMELFLYQGDKIISDNIYTFFVLAKNELLKKIKTKKRIAVYETSDVASKILNGLKLSHTRINDFTDLNNYDVLILGSHSIDRRVISAGKKINNWIKKGGRLLSLEQNRKGALPWLPELKLLRPFPQFMELVVPEHPVFAGLCQDNWNSWDGGLPIFGLVIDPLEETVLASGAVAFGPWSDMINASKKGKFIKMVIADIKSGKGKCLLSQVNVADRYGEDAVVTKYMQNLLNYVLSE